MSRGIIINFEGLDYSFKETNSKRLYEYIKRSITEKVILISFPNYESQSSYFVHEYLKKSYGDADNVNEKQASLFYAMDRYDTMKKINIEKLLDEGYYIILDRYTGSNLIFQSTKIYNKNKDNTSAESLVEDFIEWANDLEYNILQLPKPDKVIYMNMPVKISYPLMQERALKNGETEDCHESDREFMESVEKNALYTAKYLNWNIVNCINDTDQIRDEESIFMDILNIVFSNTSN